MIVNEKMAHGLSYASIKNVELDILNCITWPRKFRKGKEKTCINFNLRPKKLNTLSRQCDFDFYFIFYHQVLINTF